MLTKQRILPSSVPGLSFIPVWRAGGFHSHNPWINGTPPPDKVDVKVRRYTINTEIPRIEKNNVLSFFFTFLQPDLFTVKTASADLSKGEGHLLHFRKRLQKFWRAIPVLPLCLACTGHGRYPLKQHGGKLSHLCLQAGHKNLEKEAAPESILPKYPGKITDSEFSFLCHNINTGTAARTGKMFCSCLKQFLPYGITRPACILEVDVFLFPNWFPVFLSFSSIGYTTFYVIKRLTLTHCPPRYNLENVMRCTHISTALSVVVVGWQNRKEGSNPLHLQVMVTSAFCNMTSFIQTTKFFRRIS